jgi:hypothetical protein
LYVSAPATEIPDDGVIVRGGLMLSSDLQRSAELHFAKYPGTGYAISVFHGSGMTAEQISRAAPVPHKTVRWCLAGELRKAGYRVEPDEPHHANLFLPGPPSEPTWENLREIFSAQFEKTTL